MLGGTWQAIDNAHQKAERSSAQSPKVSGRQGFKLTE